MPQAIPCPLRHEVGEVSERKRVRLGLMDAKRADVLHVERPPSGTWSGCPGRRSCVMQNSGDGEGGRATVGTRHAFFLNRCSGHVLSLGSSAACGIAADLHALRNAAVRDHKHLKVVNAV